MKNITLIYIKWFDASFEPGPILEHEVDPELFVVTGGIFLREDDEYVTIASDFNERYDTWRNISHIPKVNIIDRKMFDVEKRVNDGKKS